MLKAVLFKGFFVNLLNLLPIPILVVGRVVAALHPALWLVGLLGLGALVVLRPNPILILILVFAATALWRRWQMRGRPGARACHPRVPGQRAPVAGAHRGRAGLRRARAIQA